MDNDGLCDIFTNYHCTCDDCPNIRYERFADRYDGDVAHDAGYEHIPCSKCHWHKKPTCVDCFFEGSEDCKKMQKREDKA